MRPTDELLREYLAGKPNEMLKDLYNEHQAAEKRRQDWCEAHEKKDDDRHILVMSAIGGHDARIRRVETNKTSIVPPNLEQYRSASDSRSFRIPENELEEAMRAVEARDALARQKAVLGAVWKVALAVATAFVLGLLGYGAHAITH